MGVISIGSVAQGLSWGAKLWANKKPTLFFPSFNFIRLSSPTRPVLLGGEVLSMSAGAPQPPDPRPKQKPPVAETGASGAVAATPRRRRKKSNNVQPIYSLARDQAKNGAGVPLPKIHFTLESIVEGISLLTHGIPAVIVHTIAHIPDNPIKAVVFMAILIAGAMAFGMEKPGKEDFCFHCILVLAFIAVGLIVICLKNPGNNDRLREMQDERVRAVGVTPFHY